MATQGFSVNAYKEDEWTPDVQDSSGNSTSIGSIANNKYTRVGNMVTLTVTISNINTAGATAGDTLRIYGIPYDADGQSYGLALANNITYSGVLTSFANDNEYLILRDFSAGTFGNILVSDLTSGAAQIILNITYFTDDPF